MPYNIGLEKRIDSLTDRFGIQDKRKMFGGVGYMLNGKMVFGIHRDSLLIRTAPEKGAELLKSGDANIFDITGRPMKGWLLIPAERIKTGKALLDWLTLSVEYVKTLPEK